MQPTTPSEELTHIRAEIARLRLREAALHPSTTDAPGDSPRPVRHRVEIVETQSRVFDIKLLPAEIRDDPKFWRDRTVQTLRCIPVQPIGGVFRPGWPLQLARSAQGVH